MTVREWFRLVRDAADLTNRPREEWQTIAAIRIGTWAEVEFWALLWAARLVAASVGQHRWVLGDYHWTCLACGASVPSDDIDETEPPASAFEPDCQCKACQPCTGRPS